MNHSFLCPLGDDEVYTTLNDEALSRWDSLNKKWGEEIYHQDGLLISETTERMSEGFPCKDFFFLILTHSKQKPSTY